MDVSKFTKSCLFAATALFIATATPAYADNDDGWFWGKGHMGQWFKGEWMGRSMMDGWGPGMMMGGRFNEQRLDALKEELAITEAQKKLWDDYAEAVKSSTKSMREAHLQMMGADIPATLPERIALHEGMMATRQNSMKSTNEATLALYNALDATQKKKADELLLGMGMM